MLCLSEVAYMFVYCRLDFFSRNSKQEDICIERKKLQNSKTCILKMHAPSNAVQFS